MVKKYYSLMLSAVVHHSSFVATERGAGRTPRGGKKQPPSQELGRKLGNGKEGRRWGRVASDQCIQEDFNAEQLEVILLDKGDRIQWQLIIGLHCIALHCNLAESCLRKDWGGESLLKDNFSFLLAGSWKEKQAGAGKEGRRSDHCRARRRFSHTFVGWLHSSVLFNQSI